MWTLGVSSPASYQKVGDPSQEGITIFSQCSSSSCGNVTIQKAERGCSKVSDSHTGEGLDTRAPETRLSPYSHGTEKQRNTNSESVLEVETDVHF